MPDLIHALQSGSTALWIFIPTAIALGALHGLEPGHSKTMMAAFIIAIHGTIAQAVLLGLSAALSHSLLIAVLAFGALRLGSQWNAETVEPYLQIASAVCVLGLALWMALRTRRELHEAHAHHHHHHHHHGDEETHRVVLGAQEMEISILEESGPAVFRLTASNNEFSTRAVDMTVETRRGDGSRQSFSFVKRDGGFESVESIPEPHEFSANVRLAVNGDRHSADVEFREPAGHSHGGEAGSEFQDAHEMEHAEDIRRRFEGRAATTPQIMLFGITGGLMPCPAAFSVLLVCLQLKRVALGATLVASFSFGLALTMVATGVLAAWSLRAAGKRFRGFGEAARRAPYVSCALLVLLAGYMAWHGFHALHGH